MSSEDLYRSQMQHEITVKRTEEEKQLSQVGVLPIVNLADKEQLSKGSFVKLEHNRKLERFTDSVAKTLPETQEPLIEDTTKKYISVTSGFNVTSLENDLLHKWKYQRFNGKDSELMTDLKAKLAAVTTEYSKTVTFTGYEDIRTQCTVMEAKYKELFSSCEAYLAKNKSPFTIAGKARKAMAQRLLAASRSEMEMLQDSAINLLEEAKLKDEAATSVTVKWEDIVHKGRLRVLEPGKEDCITGSLANTNTMEVLYTKTGRREMITIANSEDDLKKCRHIVAMSKLAQELGLGHLAGGEEMNTRMTTMIVGSKVVTACVTTGISKKKMREYQHEIRQNSRPGHDVLEKRQVSYGADYLKDLIAIPFLDYLCGVKGRTLNDVGMDKKETARGLVMGKIQTDTHELAKSGFGTTVEEFPELGDTWIDDALAKKILEVTDETIINMFTGVLEAEEMQAVLGRLHSLQNRITEKRDGRRVSPASFKSKADYARMEKDPQTVIDYVNAHANGIHTLIDTKVAGAASSINETVKQTGLLRPLADLAKEIHEPVGENKLQLTHLIEDIPKLIDTFNSYRDAAFICDESEEDFELEMQAEFEPIDTLRGYCIDYLKLSSDDEDQANRMAVSTLLHATLHQEAVYRDHLKNMRAWAKKVMSAGDDRSFEFNYDELFRESIVIAQRRMKTGDFSIDDIYAGVPFSEAEICKRLKTQTQEQLAKTLSDSLEKKEEKGDENGVLVTSIHTRFLALIEKQNALVSGGFDEFIKAIRDLSYSCTSYIAMLDEKKTKGEFTSAGRTRKKTAKAILEQLRNEYGAFVKNVDAENPSIDAFEVRRLTRKCAFMGITEDKLKISDLWIAAKKDLLTQDEKDIASGAKARLLKEKQEKKAKKKTAKEKEAEKTAAIKEQVQTGPKGFFQKDPVDMEDRLSSFTGSMSLHQTRSELDKFLGDKTVKKPPVYRAAANAFADTLDRIIELKDAPIFTEADLRNYQRKLKENDPQSPATNVIHDGVIAVYNKIAAEINEHLVPALQKYYDNEPSFGWSDAKKIMKSADATVHREFWDLKTKDHKAMDSKLIIRYIEQIMASGKPMESITYTDLTNLMLLDKAMETAVVADKPAGQTDLEALHALLSKKVGKKVIGSDNQEFSAVVEGLPSLIELKKKSDADTLRQFYDDMIGKCERYEDLHPGKNNERMKLVRRVKIVCMHERLGMEK